MSDPHVDSLIRYLDASPSPFHCVATTASHLDEQGFTRVDLSAAAETLDPGTAGYVVTGGSLVAFRIGSSPVEEAGFRIVSAHTDSPNLRIKPNPYIRNHGYVRLGVEVYGGVTVPTWSDRDLGIAGRVVLRAGDGHVGRLVNLRRPLCRIPNLAIHLNRKVNDEGLKLNKQKELPAVLALENEDDPDPLRRLLADAVGCEPLEILTWDLGLYDLTPARVSGANGEFLHAARLDNQASCHAGLTALLDADPSGSTAVLALFDHEEIGSRTSRGANGVYLRSILERLCDGDLTRALTHTWMLSADMAHAVHPAFADKHDAEHMPKLNDGPVIKQNVNQRYTTEGDSSAMFLLLCEKNEVPVQWFVNRSDLACGSTVGPMLAANLGVRSLDVGNPMLSMHSAREMCGTADHTPMIRAMTAFFEHGA